MFQVGFCLGSVVSVSTHVLSFSYLTIARSVKTSRRSSLKSASPSLLLDSTACKALVLWIAPEEADDICCRGFQDTTKSPWVSFEYTRCLAGTPQSYNRQNISALSYLCKHVYCQPVHRAKLCCLHAGTKRINP